MGALLRNLFAQSTVYRNKNKVIPGPESLLVMVSASLYFVNEWLLLMITVIFLTFN